MRKSTITRVWLGGMVAIAIGFVVAGVAVVLMLTNAGTFTATPGGKGYDFVPVENGFFWTLVGLIVAGGVVASGGAIAQFVAWIGAIANSYHLADRTWFVLTLILGLVGFGLVVMILYLLLAPDSYDETQRHAPEGRLAPPSLAPSR